MCILNQEVNAGSSQSGCAGMFCFEIMHVLNDCKEAALIQLIVQPRAHFEHYLHNTVALSVLLGHVMCSHAGKMETDFACKFRS